MIRFGVLLIAVLGALSASAHHASTGLYERDVFGEVEGEITSIFWRNPHVRFTLAVEVENGEDEGWEVEFGSVNTLERIGVTRDVVSVGDRISVYGRMGRRGLKAMFAGAMTLANGEEVPLQADVARRYGLERAAPRDPNANVDPRTALLKVWIPTERPRTGLGTTRYPLTAAGRAAVDAYDPSDDSALRCIPPGIPTAMDNPYPIQFLAEGEDLVLLLEEWDGVRNIQMTDIDDGDWLTHPRMGHSVGRWDGSTLVVETTDIGWRFVDDLGTPQSEDSIIDEQFTVSADGTRLNWEARITDPVNFAEPVVMEGVWTYVPGNELKPFNCTLPETV